MRILENGSLAERRAEKNLAAEALDLIIEKYANPIKMEDFIDIYGELGVQADKHELATANVRIRHYEDGLSPERKEKVLQDGKFAEATEAIVASCGQEYGWFGTAEVIQSSEYDDIVNSVDGFLVYEDSSGKPLVIGFDMTVNLDSADISGKIQKNIQKIVGAGAQAKYFASEDFPDLRGKIMCVPIVLGTEPGTANDLTTRVSNLDGLSGQKEMEKVRKEKRKEMELLPVQTVWIKEIQEQLSMYRFLLTKEKTPENDAVLSDVEALIKIMDALLGEKVKKQKIMPSRDRVADILSDVLKEKVRDTFRGPSSSPRPLL